MIQDIELEVGGKTLTTKTNPRPCMKWEITPPDAVEFTILPSLGAEVQSIFAVKVLAAVEVVRDVADTSSSADQDRGSAVWTAASGDGGGALGYADVDWDWWVESEC